MKTDVHAVAHGISFVDKEFCSPTQLWIRGIINEFNLLPFMSLKLLLAASILFDGRLLCTAVVSIVSVLI